jgi:hypothetical protein
VVDERRTVSDGDVRGLAVLQAALGVGPLSFWGVVVGLSLLPGFAERTATPESLQLVVLLSVAHAATGLTSWTAGSFLFERTLARGCDLASLRAATILRLALFEGVALFGAVVCLQAVLLGVAPAQPLVWLNAASTFVLLGLVIVTFPTRERVERVLRAAARRGERR